ncbi:MAG: DUF58 domain-containing protein [Pirellulales bacterium]
MSKKWKTTVCLEGWYYLIVMAFVFSAALVRDINLLMVLFGLMLGALLFGWRLAGAMLRPLEVHRRMPSMSGVGEAVAVELDIRNTQRRFPCWAIVVEDRIQCVKPRPESPPLTASLLFAQIPARQRRGMSYHGKFAHRGLYRLGPLRVSTRFPLGLLRRSRLVEIDDSLIVHPRLGRLTARWQALQMQSADGASRQQRPLGMTEGDFHGLRDWRAGDSRRWIHWRTTARRGELTVRQFERERSRDLVLVVELWQPEKSSDEQQRRVEQLLSFAATLIDDRCRSGGSRLALAVAGQSAALLSGMASAALLREALELLAVALPAASDELPATLDRVWAAAPQHAEIVVASTRGVDFTETARFASIWTDSRKQAALSQALVLSADGDDFQQWFDPGEPL